MLQNSTAIDGEEVWKVFRRTWAHFRTGRTTRPIMYKFAVHIGEALAEHLPLPATLEGVMKAQIVFLEYCVNHGYIKELCAAKTERELGGFGRDILASMATFRTRELIAGNDQRIARAMNELKSRGFDELVGMRKKLKRAARKLFDRNELTIGHLIMLQPDIFLSGI